MPKKNYGWLVLPGVFVIALAAVVLLVNARRLDDRRFAETKNQAAEYVADEKFALAANAWESYLKRLIVTRTHRLEGLQNLGVAYIGMRDYAKAVATYREAERMDPGSIAVLGGIAVAAEQEGNKALAVEYYQKVIARYEASDNNMKRFQVAGLEAKIKQLGGGQ